MAEVRNKQVVLKNYVVGFPKESDMNIVEGTITLKVPEGSSDLLLKNLYLSCDPYMSLLMAKEDDRSLGVGTYTPHCVTLTLFHHAIFSLLVLLLTSIQTNHIFLYYYVLNFHKESLWK